MTLVEIALKRPVTTIMLFVSCVVFGLLSARMLKLEFFPELDAPFILVQVPYPGSTPKEVEREIVRPLEESLATISGIDRMFANADENGAFFFLVFDWGRSLKVKLAEVRERVDAARAELPSDIQRIQVLKFSTNDEPVLQIRLSSTEGNLLDAYDLLERRIKRPLERIPGVAAVELSGVEPNEVRIELLPERIAAHGIDLNQLAQRLQRANFSSSAGLIHDGGLRYRVQPVGEVRDLAEYGELIVADAGVRLRDVAEIRYAPREIRYRRILNGHYAVGVDIRRERGANLVDVCQRVLEEVEQIRRSGALAGIELYLIGNQGEGVSASLGELSNAGWQGMLFSIAVLFFFLRHWPSTLMVSLSVPICMAISLGAMYFLGLTINVLTMMGLLLGVGMLVDNAVVVTESIFQQREKNPADRIGTAIEGTRMVQLAVSAGTLTSIIVFLPNVFGGTTQVGVFLYYVAMPMAIALLASWFVAITIIPMLAARIAPPKGIGEVRIVERWKDSFERLLRWSLAHRRATLASIVLLFASIAIPLHYVKTDFFGGNDDRDFAIRYELNGRYQLDQLEEAARSVEAWLAERKEELEIDSIYSWISEDQGMQTRLQLLKGSAAKKSVEEIQQIIREGLPALAIGRARVGGNFGGPGGGGDDGKTLAINITGDSTEVLLDLAVDVARQLETIEEFAEVRSGESNRQQEIQVRVDRERAASLGFEPAQVARLIQVAMRGVPLREFRQGDTEVPVWLRFKDAEELSLEGLKAIRVTRPDGASVPLSALVDIDMHPAATQISRDNRKTAERITLELKPEANPKRARERMEAVLKAYPFPTGYGYDLGQRFAQDDSAAKEMIFLLLLSIVLIYMVMAALFESPLYPLSIMVSIMFAVVGVYWTFLITATTFSVMAFIGIMILVGVVVNNGIVLIEHFNTLRRAGFDRDEALIMGGKERLRPILITTGTTVLGLLPLCVSDVSIGGNGPPYFPMARAIAGGLVFSTGVTLLVLPTVYAALEDAAIRIRQVWRRAAPGGAVAETA
jgi:HAE1 family hydrophobic/amphiphilic exporter-1